MAEVEGKTSSKEMTTGRINQEKGQSFRGGWQPSGRGGRGGRGRFDKSPNIRKPRVASKNSNPEQMLQLQ